MAHRGRRNADEQLQLALACGATVESAALKAGVGVATVYRRLKDADFRRSVREVRTDILQRTAAALSAASTEAVKTLLELQKPAHGGAVRLGAARSVLEIGMKLRELSELEERLAALEDQVARGGSAA